MRFMFKIVVWGFIALLVLPSVAPLPQDKNLDGEHSQVASEKAGESFTSADAFYMAVGVGQYLRDICSHDAELCESGGRLVEATFDRAKQGVVVLADMVEEHRSNVRDTQDTTITSSIN